MSYASELSSAGMRETLSQAGQRLAAAIERPESMSVGSFAALVGRLHSELGMLSHQHLHEDLSVEIDGEIFAIEDWSASASAIRAPQQSA